MVASIVVASIGFWPQGIYAQESAFFLEDAAIETPQAQAVEFDIATMANAEIDIASILVSQPANGSITRSDTILTYTPHVDFTGSEVVTVWADQRINVDDVRVPQPDKPAISGELTITVLASQEQSQGSVLGASDDSTASGAVLAETGVGTDVGAPLLGVGLIIVSLQLMRKTRRSAGYRLPDGSW